MGFLCGLLATFVRSVLLDQSTWRERYMHQLGHHHSFHACDVGYLRSLRLHLRDLPGLPHQGPEYEPELEFLSHPYSDHGMRCKPSRHSPPRLRHNLQGPQISLRHRSIAMWPELEMILAITSGSMPTLRPLYRVAANKFSWKSSYISAYRSVQVSRSTLTIGGTAISSKEAGHISCSESERKIVNSIGER
ncbi:hypothetical protein PMIN07_006748 [Paraphaeosphaeria minitans]